MTTRKSTKIKFSITYDVDIEVDNIEDLNIYAGIVRKYLPPNCSPGSARSYVNSEVITPKLSSAEQRLIEEALFEADGNVRKAARILDITHATLYAKMKTYGIKTKRELFKELTDGKV